MERHFFQFLQLDKDYPKELAASLRSFNFTFKHSRHKHVQLSTTIHINPASKPDPWSLIRLTQRHPALSAPGGGRPCKSLFAIKDKKVPVMNPFYHLYEDGDRSKPKDASTPTAELQAKLLFRETFEANGT